MAGVYRELYPGILCWLSINRAWKQVPIFFVPVNIFLHSVMFKFNIPFFIYAPKTYKLFLKFVSSTLAFLVGDVTMLVTSVKYIYIFIYLSKMASKFGSKLILLFIFFLPQSCLLIPTSFPC